MPLLQKIGPPLNQHLELGAFAYFCRPSQLSPFLTMRVIRAQIRFSLRQCSFFFVWFVLGWGVFVGVGQQEVALFVF